MTASPTTSTTELLRAVLGARRSEEILASLHLPPLPASAEGRATGPELSTALALVLFEDVVQRVTWARAYVRDLYRAGRRLWFDHGALRTVAAPCGCWS